MSGRRDLGISAVVLLVILFAAFLVTRDDSAPAPIPTQQPQSERIDPALQARLNNMLTYMWSERTTDEIAWACETGGVGAMVDASLDGIGGEDPAVAGDPAVREYLTGWIGTACEVATP